ncbi:MAG: peptidoglycan-binding protein [Candidatus Sericytochromatia bacterium]|nr:peptidoglycan-binding protein [Candidatus Sericytochromatia bacterium]
MSTGLMIGPIFLQIQDLWLTLLTLALVFPLGRKYGHTLAKQGLNLDTAFQTGLRKWGFLFGFLTVCGLIAAIYKFPHLLNPWVLGVLEPAAWLAAKGGALFLAGMAGPLGKNAKKAEVIALYSLACFSTLGVQGLQGYFLRPISQSSLFERISSDGSILQSTNVSCTAAAFANALRLFEIEATEKEVARILGTRDSGTSQIQLLNGLRKYGLFGHYVSVLPEHLARMQRPAMVSVDLFVITHSILTYGSDTKGNILIIDPVSGKGKLTADQFRKKLKETQGVVLTDRPLPTVDAESPRFLQKQVQEILLHEKYLKERPSNWDNSTRAALKAFQIQWKIPATGQVDDLTWLLLTGPKQKMDHNEN